MEICDKIGYHSRSEAEAVKGYIAKRKTHNGPKPSRVYKCDMCHLWHLASADKVRRK